MKLLVSTILLSGCAAASVDPAPDFSLEFWAESGAEKVQGVSQIYEHHACSGNVAIVRVERLPPPQSKGPLVPELVEELDARGKTIRRWSMPVDSYVAAVEGESIFVRPFAHPLGNSLRIDTSGIFAPANTTTEENKQWVQCPGAVEDGSAYRRCFEYKDSSSGAVRLLTYQGPCT